VDVDAASRRFLRGTYRTNFRILISRDFYRSRIRSMKPPGDQVAVVGMRKSVRGKGGVVVRELGRM
jgi:hypothetical protein